MDNEHVDVLIIGAGISGIGAAHHLQAQLPGKTYAILEARDAIGGTWDLFRYPGIRSDSDMHTLGYRFRPWIDRKAIADAPRILDYLHATVREAWIDRHIRVGHKVVRAEWSTPDARWTVTAEHGGAEVVMTCGFLYCCGGCYRHDEGFTPRFDGIERFGGPIIHPQHWPESLDYRGKRVVIVGSGATAVTLVPAMCDEAAHVTMLQRSPGYILPIPEEDPIANGLRRALPDKLAYVLTRWKNVALQTLSYQFGKRCPTLARAALRRLAIHMLPPGYDVDTHFTPSYDPWDQRPCFIPNGDFFKALSSGKGSVVTDRITSFTERGVLLESGCELEADIIVTATGFNLQLMSGFALTVDGEDVEISGRMAYKALMLSGVPNLAFTMGYLNASWTLKADLVAEYVCRLLSHMDDGDRRIVVAAADPSVQEAPFLDEFAPGFVRRAEHLLPRAGDVGPWRSRALTSYARDLVEIRHGAIADGVLQFSSPVRSEEPALAA